MTKLKNHIFIDNNKISKIKNNFHSFNKKILSIHLRLGDYIELNDYHYNAPSRLL